MSYLDELNQRVKELEISLLTMRAVVNMGYAVQQGGAAAPSPQVQSGLNCLDEVLHAQEKGIRTVQVENVRRLRDFALEEAALECEKVGWCEDQEYAERIRKLKSSNGG